MEEKQDQAGLSAGAVNLRLYLFVPTVLVVAGALAAGTIGYVVLAYLRDEPLSHGDWVGVAFNGPLSLVIAWLGVRAGHRAGLKARLVVPALLVVGAILGIRFVYGAMESHREYDRGEANRLCETVLAKDATPPNLSACATIAVRCLAEARIVRSTPNRGAHYEPDDFEDKPEVKCTRERLGLSR